MKWSKTVINKLKIGEKKKGVVAKKETSQTMLKNKKKTFIKNLKSPVAESKKNRPKTDALPYN